MLKYFITFTLALTLLNGCVDSPRNYFKRSANNKLLDPHNPKKRRPLYNNKYINLAKRNILEQNIDDDYYDEDEEIDYPLTPTPARANVQMYANMIKHDQAHAVARNQYNQRRDRYSDIKYQNNNRYPSLAQADKKLRIGAEDEQDLQQQLAEIKVMLNQTQKDLAKYKCPVVEISPPIVTPPTVKTPKPELPMNKEVLEEELKDITYTKRPSKI